jgi:beta-galactosidase
VVVEATIENHTSQRSAVEIDIEILDPQGGAVDKQHNTLSLNAGDSQTTAFTFRVASPQLWDVDSPNLYVAITRIRGPDNFADSVETTFGIRTFEFTSDDGFHLNGRRLQLHGVCLHHDLGPLGAAFNSRAMERQLEIMQNMGVNALRTSHNPPAPEVLDLCDRMGFVVWDEVFDKWDATATRPESVSMVEHGWKQIPQMILRDRNHPSVVVWSVGNEVWDLELGNFDEGPDLLRQMVEAARSVDPTRPVTLAHCVPDSAKTDLDACLDVTGWNYARRYANSRERWPDLPIIYSESASALSTRGYYHLPHPEAKDDYPESARISSYDHNAASYSDIPDVEFALMEQDRFVAGEFVWTGFDYLGEPYPYYAEGWGAFPKRKLTPSETSRTSSYGIVDLVGIPKDRYYLYRSHWAPEKRTIHILPHWNWPERVGKIVPVYVYTNGDSAELFINGVSQGRKTKDKAAGNVMDRYRLRWEDTVYQPGELQVIAYQGEQELGEARRHTAGPAARLRLTPDREALMADGDDLAYVLVEALDEKGNPQPLAMHEVRFRVSGAATIAGVGNGDHYFPAEFDTDRVALFYGKAMLIVRTEKGIAGAIQVEAESADLQPASVSLRSE